MERAQHARERLDSASRAHEGAGRRQETGSPSCGAADGRLAGASGKPSEVQEGQISILNYRRPKPNLGREQDQGAVGPPHVADLAGFGETSWRRSRRGYTPALRQS